jgi:D-3-phosphoglycerate dehydrogenase
MGAQTKEANINAGVASAEQIINFIEKGDETFKVN